MHFDCFRKIEKLARDKDNSTVHLSVLIIWSTTHTLAWSNPSLYCLIYKGRVWQVKSKEMKTAERSSWEEPSGSICWIKASLKACKAPRIRNPLKFKQPMWCLLKSQPTHTESPSYQTWTSWTNLCPFQWSSQPSWLWGWHESRMALLDIAK